LREHPARYGAAAVAAVTLLAHEIVRIDHASHAAIVACLSGSWLVRANHASAALHYHWFFRASDFGRKRNLELDVRTDFERGIGADVDPGSAQVPRHTAMLSAFFRAVNFYG
jgi:hypothetical protein